MYPRVGRAYSVGKPWVTGAKRPLDLFELTPLMLRERHGALRETQAGTLSLAFALTAQLMPRTSAAAQAGSARQQGVGNGRPGPCYRFGA